MSTATSANAKATRPATPFVWRPRVAVAARVLAATVAGYFFAHGLTAFLTLVLPFARDDRVIAASMFAFVAWCAVAIYAFAARSAWRAWLCPVLGGAALLGVTLAFPQFAARA